MASVGPMRGGGGARAQDHRTRFLAELAVATQPLTEPDDIMRTSARLLTVFLGADRCAYANVEDASVFVITGDYSRNGLRSIVGRWDVAAFGRACDAAMRGGVSFVVDDAGTDARLEAGDLAAYRATGIVAVVCVPLLKEGVFTAAMAVHQGAPRTWAPEDIELVEQVVSRCWESLERARMARALVESEARYRAMVEANPECVQLVAADGTLLQINTAGAALLQAAGPEAAVGTCMYDLVMPEHRAMFQAFNQRVCTGEAGELAYEICGFGGRRRAVETRAVPLALPSGGYAHLAVSRDVTERLASERALAESRARLDFAVRVSGIGFWYCDLPFEELEWDARVREHFCIARDARVTLDTFYDHIHPEDRQRTREAIDSAIAGRTAYDTQYRVVDAATGVTKWIRALGGAAYAADGTPTRFDGVTVDISAQKEVEQSAQGLAARLQDADRRKDEFLAMLAHELRNPLAPVGTAAQILKRTRDDPATIRQAADIIERQVSHLTSIVDDLLDVSRVTRGLVSIERDQVDLRAVAAAAVEQVQPLLRARRHELHTTQVGSDFFVEGDYHRLVQVVTNLLTNAAKYTPHHGSISLQVGSEGGDAIMRVSDDGIGIPADLLPEVFELFIQGARTPDRTQGGLGIGLALVRSLVALHGGRVEAMSEGINRGSTFTVRLPLAPSAASLPPAEPASVDSAPGLRILVVDDNHDAAATLGTLLRMLGHQVAIAADGASAVALAAGSRWDACILDIGLPDMTGFALARRLAEMPEADGALFIALTGYGQAQDQAMSREAGFAHHLVKPPDIPRLLAILERRGR